MNRFPHKLYDVLNTLASSEGDSASVKWLSHGRAFVVVNQDRLVDVLPLYFNQTKFKSFTRQLNLWGFRRTTDGDYEGVWHHKHFIRDNPSQLNNVTRRSPKESSQSSKIIEKCKLHHGEKTKERIALTSSASHPTSVACNLGQDTQCPESLVITSGFSKVETLPPISECVGMEKTKKRDAKLSCSINETTTPETQVLKRRMTILDMSGNLHEPNLNYLSKVERFNPMIIAARRNTWHCSDSNSFSLRPTPQGLMFQFQTSLEERPSKEVDNAQPSVSDYLELLRPVVSDTLRNEYYSTLDELKTNQDTAFVSGFKSEGGRTTPSNCSHYKAIKSVELEEEGQLYTTQDAPNTDTSSCCFADVSDSELERFKSMYFPE